MMMFTTPHPEPPKTVIIPDPPAPPAGKSKKAKKKAKKAAAAEMNDPPKTDGTKMVTLRNPMFHPNLPSVQISTTPTQKKAEQIRVPDPIPMPPNACQATITPTSNGMYTIRNPIMSIMHQQNMINMRNPTPPMPIFNQPYNYVNPNFTQNQGYVLDPARASPKQEDYQNRIMNLASFTQKNDEGYSLFKTNDDSQQRNFLAPEFYENSSPKLVVSPNPIGTRPEQNRFENDNTSLFANPIQRPEPIGTPLKRDEERFELKREEYQGLYTPFGQEDRNVFRNALFDKNDANISAKYDDLPNHLANGDSLPYFQRLRVGSKLNNEVTIHHVTESKFYRQEPSLPQVDLPPHADDSLFSRPMSNAQPWADPLFGQPQNNGNKRADGAARGEDNYGPVGARGHSHEPSVFLPDASITNLSSLEACEREIESFKRFEWYYSPPEHKPKVQLHVSDIANSLKHNHK